MPVTNWDNIVLSTMSSIIKHERELQKLCGMKVLKQLSFVSSPSKRILVDTLTQPPPPTFTAKWEECSCRIKLSDNQWYPTDNSNNSIFEINSNFANTGLHVLAIEFDIHYSSQSYTGRLNCKGIMQAEDPALFDRTTYFVELNPYIFPNNTVPGDFPASNMIEVAFNGIEWVTVTNGGSWADKIDVAKSIIGFDLEKLLTDHNITVDEAAGQKLLNVIQNPQTFALASDYKTIQLIYQDLSESSLNGELYAKKAEHYARQYRDDLFQAWLRINLDPSLSGTTDVYRADLIGEMER